MRRKPYGFPKFKSKRKSKKSYTTKFTNNNIQLNLEEKKIKLPNFFYIALTVQGTGVIRFKPTHYQIKGSSLLKSNEMEN